MSEPAGNGPVEAGEANLGGIATTLLGIFMMLTASLGALWIAAGSVLMAQCTQTWTFLIASALMGLGFGPMITALSLQLGKLTPSHYSTEAFTWSTTLFMIGLGVGFWVGGGLIEYSGWVATLYACVAMMLAAGAWCFAVPDVTHHHHPSDRA